MTRVLLFGLPGSGKGTQADFLQRDFNYSKISTGDLARAEVAAGTPLGRRIQAVIDSGALVGDRIMIELVRQRLRSLAGVDGYILDGFPRNFAQAKALSRLSVRREFAIYLDVPEATVVRRLLERLVCESCGAIFNLKGEAPTAAERCDLCGGMMRKRTDDSEQTIRHRIAVYRDETVPVIEFYRRKKKLSTVDAGAAAEQVYEQVRSIVA